MTFRIAAVISLIGGTMFLMWLGEQITSRGIGNDKDQAHRIDAARTPAFQQVDECRRQVGDDARHDDFRIAAVISLIGGTMFLMWLGEQITSRGIGNGVSLPAAMK
jgi:preprotein translocase subunit SecY